MSIETFFQTSYYLTQNTDVAALWAGSAVNHYAQYGASEGRAPASWFNATYYRSTYSDLQSLTALQCWEHYSNFGYAETRATSSTYANFNEAAYLAAYSDLGAAGITAATALNHYLVFGATESRVATNDDGSTISGTTSATGTTFTLTTGGDAGSAFTGTAGNDTFNAMVASSFSAGDTLNGGAGTDTLNVVNTGVTLTNPLSTTVTAIETATMITDTTATSLNTTAWTGLTTLNVTGITAMAVTAAATTAVTMTRTTATGAATVNGGSTVSVTETGSSAGTLIIGGTTAAAGAVTVTSTGLTTNGATSNAITVTGGTTVTVTQVAGNAATTGVDTTAGAVTVTGNASTTAVTVRDTAAGTGFTATATATGVVGRVNGAVTIADANAASATAAGTLATVTLGSFAAATIDSSALTTVNLSGTGTSLGIGRGALTATPTANTLAVNLNGLTLTGALTDSEAAADNGFTTVNIASTTTASTLGSLAIADATALNISGDALFTSGGETLTSITDITVTNTAGAVLATALGTAVNFAGGAGADTISIGSTTKAITLGAGNDTVTTSSALVGTGGSVAAGDGTGDKIIMTAAQAVTSAGSSTFNSKFTGFEVLQLSDILAAGTTTDLDGINSVSKVILAAGGNHASTAIISNLDSGGTVQTNANSTGATINVTSAVAGTADVLNLTLYKSSGILAAGSFTSANVETINISTADAATTGSNAVIHTLTLAATSATSVVVTGNNGLTLTNTGNVAITNFDASGVVANNTLATATVAATTDSAANLAVTFLSANTTTANAVTITGGAGNDTLTGVANVDTITGGLGADTLKGGLGADSIILTEATAAIDNVIITGGLTADTVTGFTTGTGGDNIQMDISDLETAGAVVAGVTFTLDDMVDGTTAIGAQVVTIQEVADQAGGAAVAAAGAGTLYVLLSETYANVAAVETGLETGDHELTVAAGAGTSDAFMVLWSDGTDTYLSSMYIATDSGADFLAADLVGTNLVKLVGNPSIAASEFVAGNFEFIA